MHIAICDDNVADRKQLERLLDRESDRRKEEKGVFYTDSFGTGDKLYSARMSYDLFFIDVTESDETGFFLANRLCRGGVTAPVVLCSSKIDYKEEALKVQDLPRNILFLNKPILKAQLSAILDDAIQVEEDKEPTIELRDKEETYYVREDDIVYAEADKGYISVHLKDGRTASMYGDLYSFYGNIRIFTHYAMLGPHAIVNGVYVKKYNMLSAELKGKVKINMTPPGYLALRKVMKKIKEEREEKEDS